MSGDAGVWVDFNGKGWPCVSSRRRLKFKYPAHAALRAHVYHRDGYSCRRCGVLAVFVPDGYDGREALECYRVNADGWRESLVIDHVLTLKAGGENRASNLQTLCETCNRRKQSEDLIAIAAHRRAST